MALWLPDLAFRAIVIPNGVCRMLRQGIARFWILSVGRALPPLACGALCGWAVSEVSRGSILHLIGVPVATSSAMLVAAFLVAFDENERALMRRACRISRGSVLQALRFLLPAWLARRGEEAMGQTQE